MAQNICLGCMAEVFFFILYRLICGVDLHIHVARLYTSSPTVHSLWYHPSLYNHLPLGLHPFLLTCSFISIACLPSSYVAWRKWKSWWARRHSDRITAIEGGGGGVESSWVIKCLVAQSWICHLDRVVHIMKENRFLDLDHKWAPPWVCTPGFNLHPSILWIQSAVTTGPSWMEGRV